VIRNSPKSLITTTCTYPRIHPYLVPAAESSQEEVARVSHNAGRTASSDPGFASREHRRIVLGRHPPPLDEMHSSEDDDDDEDPLASTEQGVGEIDSSEQGSEGLGPPEVDDTDVMLMDVYPVHGPERTVEAIITSDGDSITVTGTDISDVMPGAQIVCTRILAMPLPARAIDSNRGFMGRRAIPQLSRSFGIWSYFAFPTDPSLSLSRFTS
jgi:hypothetical protein